MATAVALHKGNGNDDASGALMESVIIKGDLSKLTPEARASYYMTVCKSVGLNPLTKPFEYITLNGKLTLYALRNCTDQLRTIHGVSVLDMTDADREGVHIVTCKVANRDGRTDIARGAVNISKLQGEALANAMMKAETKAKRRATLSICGLGFLDETEIEDISPEAKQIAGARRLPKKDARATYDRLQTELREQKTVAALDAWGKANGERIRLLPEDWEDILRSHYLDHKISLQGGSTSDKTVWENKPQQQAAIEDPDPENLLRWIDGKLGVVTEASDLASVWNDVIEPKMDPLFPPDREAALALWTKHARRLGIED